ncbi:hypothetical protein GOBAR_AA30909 [Gossypium barbadense]|uniref:Uncharacterized protein n=1 Tax=Gossypium barbadense TaxID=3634 RepID=A0A2P5WF91_GOSBA|nr:hypothetical protein GOBAR_AA30909 [Gossypium barbadense]
MLRYQWEDAVRFWNQRKERYYDRKRVVTSNKQKQKFTHTAGSRSFASVAEAEEVSSGQKVGRLQLFEITHRKKDGSPMTFEAGQIMIAQMQARTVEQIAEVERKYEELQQQLRADAATRKAVVAAREAEATSMVAE